MTKKLALALVASLGCLAMSSASAAGWSGTRKVTHVTINETHDLIITLNSGHDNPDGCGNAAKVMVPYLDNQGVPNPTIEARMAVALSAFATQQDIKFYFKGCRSGNGSSNDYAKVVNITIMLPE